MHIVVQGHVHQHAAGRALSRRGAPGGRLLHRAHDRACRQADRHGRRRNPPPRTSFRRTSSPTPRRPASPMTRASSCACLDKCVGYGRLEGLREAQEASRIRTASCAAARSASTSSSAASSTTVWTSGSIRAAPSRCSAARTRTARATRRCSRSSCMSSSACRSRRFRYVQGDTAQVSIRPRHLRRAVGGGRRQRAQAAVDQIIDKAKPMAAAMMEADAGDIEFEDGLTSRWRAPTRRSRLLKWRKRRSCPDGPNDQVRHRPRTPFQHPAIGEFQRLSSWVEVAGKVFPPEGRLLLPGK